jgi:hypothetical protein
MASKCGFQMDHNISIWSSPNLTSGSWSYVGNAINVADRPAGILFSYDLYLIVYECCQYRCCFSSTSCL